MVNSDPTAAYYVVVISGHDDPDSSGANPCRDGSGEPLQFHDIDHAIEFANREQKDCDAYGISHRCGIEPRYPE